MYQDSTGLLVHEYDASRCALWADTFTGARGVDSVELLVNGLNAHAHLDGWLVTHFRTLMDSVMRFMDEDMRRGTRLWIRREGKELHREQCECMVCVCVVDGLEDGCFGGGGEIYGCCEAGV